jgi:hypothetical protein
LTRQVRVLFVVAARGRAATAEVLAVGPGPVAGTIAARGYGTDVTLSAAGGGHGFGAALTSLIGRAGPLREVTGLLWEYRLLAVTGPGGRGQDPARR